MHEGNHMGIMTTLKKPTLESPARGGRSPWRRKLDLTAVDRMLERAKEGTRRGQDTERAYARGAAARGMVGEAYRDHDGLRHAVATRRRPALASRHGAIQEAKRRLVARSRGATCRGRGCDWRRGKSRSGVWRPWDTPRQHKRTALRRKVPDICRRYASPPGERGSALLTPLRRGWVRDCAVGASSRCWGFLKAWVAKNVRRHRRRARNRKGLGWQRGRRRWLDDTWRLFHAYRGRRRQPQALPVR